jgi:hypothetical protein
MKCARTVALVAGTCVLALAGMAVAASPLATLAAALLNSAALGQPGPESHIVGTEAACRLGAEVIREESSASLLVFEGTEQRLPNYSGFVHDPHLAGKIPPDIEHAADRATPSNLFVACPALAGELPQGARMATDEDRAKLRGPGAPPRPYITTIETPVLDPSGSVALVFEYHDCGDLCGNGGLYLYSHVDGRWMRSEKIVGILS